MTTLKSKKYWLALGELILNKKTDLYEFTAETKNKGHKYNEFNINIDRTEKDLLIIFDKNFSVVDLQLSNNDVGVSIYEGCIQFKFRNNIKPEKFYICVTLIKRP
jgi:hypothetical protein